MTKIELLNQNMAEVAIAPKATRLILEMNKRKEMWAKISPEQRTTWIKSGKDPIMLVAWKMYKYLRNNFFMETLNEVE